MPFVRTIASLGSRLARSRVVQGGVRRIAPFKSAIQPQSGGISGALKWLWGGIKKLAGIVGFTLSGLWSLVTNAAGFIWNFNWNITEEEIEQEAKAAWNKLGANLGALTGQSLGWAFCGALPGMAIGAFNPALGAWVLEEVGREAFEEIAGTLKSVVQETARSYTRVAFLKIYASARKALELNLGKNVKDKDRKPWSLALKWDEYIENIDNQFIANFLEEAREEFAEACTEAGFVVVNSIEGFYANQQQAIAASAGPERTVEIQLRR